MKKPLLLASALVLGTCLCAQIEVFTIVGKNSKEFSHKFGVGAFFKLSVPVNQGSDEITGEIGLMGMDGYTTGFATLKAGYRTR